MKSARRFRVVGAAVSAELAIHRVATPWMVSIMVVLTNLGSGIALAIVSALATVLCFCRKERRLALILIGNGVVVLGLEMNLKYAFGRARPTLFPEISLPSDSSFPSGHSMASMAVYGTLAVVLRTLYPRRGLAIAASPLLIASIGFSRVLLGVHWPSDVAAGFAAGVPFVLVAIYLAEPEPAVSRTERSAR